MCDKNVDKIGDNIDDNNTEDAVDDTDGSDDESDESDDEDVSEDDDNDGEVASGADDDETDVDDESDDETCAPELIVGPSGGQSPSEPICHICLNRFTGQDIGSPDSCADLHYFCLDCIEEWSKQINTCPVDRNRFTYIIVRREIGSTIIMKIPIVQNIVPDIETVPEDVTYCEICGRCDREDRLLLCDGCDFGYHCECLSPPLETIPIEEWFCPDCYQRLFGPETSGATAAATFQRRAIARTGASEAVRQRILQRRLQRKKTKRKPKRKTTRRKRKSTKRKSTGAKTGAKTGRKKRRTKRRRKRRTKKSAFASRRLPAADARTRIASKLGIGPAPKSPFGLPSMKNLAYESIRRITDLRAAAGISNLSMFGTELDVYDPRVMIADDDNQPEGLASSSGDVLARSRVNGRLIGSPIKHKSNLLDLNGSSNGLLSASTSSIDLLSEIMSSQQLLHSSARDVRIARDGSLHLKRMNSSPGSPPVRSCPNSSGQSSPARSPPNASPTHSNSGSPQRIDTNSSNTNNNSFNYSFGSAGRTTSADNISGSYGVDEDIGSIKPVPTPPPELALDADDAKVELYSDIESLGDNNREDSDSAPDNDEKLVIDDPAAGLQHTGATDAIETQSYSQEPEEKAPKNSDNNSDTKTDSTDRSTIAAAVTTTTTTDTKPNIKTETTPNKPKTNITKPIIGTSSAKPAKLTQQKPPISAGPAKTVNPKPRRKHSIKDLFGDSSDEDEEVMDSDIRRLLTEQGSINVHYPIKIPIVLKNSMNSNKIESISDASSVLGNQSVPTVSSAVDPMDCEPAIDTNKWIAVNPAGTTGLITTTTTHAINKWKAIESIDTPSVVTPSNSESTTSASVAAPVADTALDVINSKPIDDASEMAGAVESVVADIDTGVKDLTTDESIDVNVSESDVHLTDVQLIGAESGGQLAAGPVDEEEGEIRDDEQKVRRCRHGRIRREKPKDAAISRDSSSKSRHRSRSSESKGKHRVVDKESGSGNRVDSSFSGNENELLSNDSCVDVNVEFKDKKIEPKETSVGESVDGESDERIGWKKLSNTTKMRSYRDGKPKDEQLLFREREVQKKLIKKSVLVSKNKSKTTDNAKQSAKDATLDRHSAKVKTQSTGRLDEPATGPEESKHSRKHRSDVDKAVDERTQRHKLRKSVDLVPKAPIPAKNKRPKRAAESTRSGSSARRSGDDYSSDRAPGDKDRHKRHHKSSRHKHSSVNRDSLDRISGSAGAGSGGVDRRHSHRSSKRSHHSSGKGKSGSAGAADSDVLPHKLVSGAATAGKILRDHSSYADITPLDSKEIYAEGDRIVINVNFKRDNTKKPIESSVTDDQNYGKQSAEHSVHETADTTTGRTRKTSQNESTSKRISSKKDDSIYWASPPPPTGPANSTGSSQTLASNANQSSQSTPNPLTTTTIVRIDDALSPSSSSSGSSSQPSGGRTVGSGSERKVSEKPEIEAKKDPKLVDELRFLPRSLHQSSDALQTTTTVSEPPVPAYGPHTPEGEYNEDQFMPTPTQDESQSPFKSNSMTSSSRSSPLSGRSSPALSNSVGKDDVYDPEAPLQSPVDHQSGGSSGKASTAKKSSSRRDTKSPDVAPSGRRDSKRSPQLSAQPTARRQLSSSGADHQSKYSPAKDTHPKSSPIGSASAGQSALTTHSQSNRSPFKSPSVLPPQRQQMKSSPQKSSQNAPQKSSSSALMPPPQLPTSRPQSSAASFAVTAAAIASINPQNLAQLLQMAQTLGAKQSAGALKHQQTSTGQSGGRAPAHQRHGSSAPSTNSAKNSLQNHNQNNGNNRDHNRDHTEVVDMDVESPSPPPASSQTVAPSQQPRVSSTTPTTTATVKTLWDQIIKSTQQTKPNVLTQMLAQKRLNTGTGRPGSDAKKQRTDSHSGAGVVGLGSAGAKDRHQHHRHQVISVATDSKKGQSVPAGSKLDQLTVLDDVPSSAVEMAVKEKFIKKLNRQERVIEEVKLVLKPHYQKRTVSKDEYKEILRKSVPKICHSRSGEINPLKIRSLIDGYIKRFKYLKKKSKKLTKN